MLDEQSLRIREISESMTRSDLFLVREIINDVLVEKKNESSL